MKTAYFDCFSGISGDMCLGAIVDAGVSLKDLEKVLKGIPINGYRLVAKKVKRAGFEATKVDVETTQSTPASLCEAGRAEHRQKTEGRTQNTEVRKWKDIEGIIKNSSLSKGSKQKGLKIFRRLFEAEAKVHGEAYDKVHLHELGAMDCIVDIFGTLVGLDILGIEEVHSSPINLGSGYVKAEHGILPVPAPATAEILKGIPVYSADIPFELTTPTGAAILREIASNFGNIPDMSIEKIGCGAGNKDLKERPNVLRLFIGERTEHPGLALRSGAGRAQNPSAMLRTGTEHRVTIIETNIDDMNPQIYEYVMERLFKAGAYDVYLTQVLMKKGRPGVKLTVLCNGDKREELMKIILRETTTIGLRFFMADRRTLERKIEEIETEFGKLRVKVARLGDEILKITPEYEDCKKIAKRFNIPLIGVIEKLRGYIK